MGRRAKVVQRQGWKDVYYTRSAFKQEFQGRTPEMYGYAFGEEDLLNEKRNVLHCVEGTVGKFEVEVEQEIYIGWQHTLDDGRVCISDVSALLGFQDRVKSLCDPYSFETTTEMSNPEKEKHPLPSLQIFRQPPEKDLSKPAEADRPNKGEGRDDVGISLNFEGLGSRTVGTVGFERVGEDPLLAQMRAQQERQQSASASASVSNAQGEKSEDQQARERFVTTVSALRANYKYLSTEDLRLMHLDQETVASLCQNVTQASKACAKLRMSAEVRQFNDIVSCEMLAFKALIPEFGKYKAWISKPSEGRKKSFKQVMAAAQKSPILWASIGYAEMGCYKAHCAGNALATQEISMDEVSVFSVLAMTGKEPFITMSQHFKFMNQEKLLIQPTRAALKICESFGEIPKKREPLKQMITWVRQDGTGAFAVDPPAVAHLCSQGQANTLEDDVTHFKMLVTADVEYPCCSSPLGSSLRDILGLGRAVDSCKLQLRLTGHKGLRPNEAVAPDRSQGLPGCKASLLDVFPGSVTISVMVLVEAVQGFE